MYYLCYSIQITGNMTDAIIGAVCGFAGTLITYLSMRKKNNADSISSELDAVHKALGIWRETSERLSEDVKKLTNEVQELHIIVKELKEENSRLRQATGQTGTTRINLRQSPPTA